MAGCQPTNSWPNGISIVRASSPRLGATPSPATYPEDTPSLEIPLNIQDLKLAQPETVVEIQLCLRERMMELFEGNFESPDWPLMRHTRRQPTSFNPSTNESGLMILSGRWVIPVSSPPLDHGAIAIEGSRILEVGSLENDLQALSWSPVEEFP